MAGPLGRPASEQIPSDEVFRPGTITSFEAAAAR
jgi:hypothetical protein